MSDQKPPKVRPFTPDEDAVIMRARLADPPESWTAIADRLEQRNAWQCKYRWKRCLAPEVNSGPWTPEEDQLLVDKINEMGTAWAAMKYSFQGRTSDALENRWHRHIKNKTVHDGTKFIYTESDRTSQANHRKEYVQEEMEPNISQPLLMNSVPTQQRSQRPAKKLHFTPQEDAVMTRARLEDPPERWYKIARRLGQRTGRQCRERWTRCLAPELNSEPWTPEEDQLLVDRVNEIGRCWAAMKDSFKGRSDNALRNRWNGYIKAQIVHDGTKFIYTERKRKTYPRKAALARTQDLSENARLVRERKTCPRTKFIYTERKRKTCPRKAAQDLSCPRW
jgi:hypothetical protein